MQLNSVLITGGAGDIGRGVAKILRGIPWIKSVHGMDIEDTFPSTVFYDSFVRAPAVLEANYLDALAEKVSVSGAELIIPMSEPELRFFTENRITEVSGVPLLMPSFNAMELGFDKLATSNYLKESGLPFPWTTRADKAAPLGFPCIMKSRSGSGSKEVTILTNKNFREASVTSEDFIYQELLLPDNEEYTCGVFRSKSGVMSSIAIRRILAGGRTGRGQVIQNEDIDVLLNAISDKLQFTGSINVQLRLTDRGPVVFEINPRFSSTVTFRHMLGFRDVEWAILDQFDALKNVEFDQRLVEGKRIFRADNEIIY